MTYRFPIESKVQALREVDSGYEVLLVFSAAIHVLFRTNPDFEALLLALQSALQDDAEVLVTEDDERGIIDVRPALLDRRER